MSSHDESSNIDDSTLHTNTSDSEDSTSPEHESFNDKKTSHTVLIRYTLIVLLLLIILIFFIILLLLLYFLFFSSSSSSSVNDHTLNYQHTNSLLDSFFRMEPHFIQSLEEDGAVFYEAVFDSYCCPENMASERVDTSECRVLIMGQVFELPSKDGGENIKRMGMSGGVAETEPWLEQQKFFEEMCDVQKGEYLRVRLRSLRAMPNLYICNGKCAARSFNRFIADRGFLIDDIIKAGQGDAELVALSPEEQREHVEEALKDAYDRDVGGYCHRMRREGELNIDRTTPEYPYYRGDLIADELMPENERRMMTEGKTDYDLMFYKEVMREYCNEEMVTLQLPYGVEVEANCGSIPGEVVCVQRSVKGGFISGGWPHFAPEEFNDGNFY